MRIKAKAQEEVIKPVSDDDLPPEFKKFDKPFGVEQHVLNIILVGILGHASAIYSLFYLVLFGHVSIGAIVLGMSYGYVTGLGTTVGSHRYWTHKTFKATKPLQYLLMLMQTAGVQYPIFKWCRDHRVHHKYMDTNADPHNSARGFWFSHITWLFLPKHPEVEEKLKIVNISDLVKDPVVRFQSKYYWEMVVVVYFILPMTICYWVYPEMTLVQLITWNFTRHCISLHFTFLVNSAAHKWGDKPYDKSITPTENKLVSILAVGEGWHNYHHTFPWDYKSAEYGFKLNFSTLFIHFFAMIGWAYEMKTVSHKLLVDRVNRTGDGSHPLHERNSGNKNEDTGDASKRSYWGWGDENISKEDIEITETVFPLRTHRG